MSLNIDKELNPCGEPFYSNSEDRCTTSMGDTMCRRCGRTEEQIRDWPTMTDYQKRAIVQGIKYRSGYMKANFPT